MTSRNLYWAKWRENGKRRSWTFVLSMAAMLLLYPVYTVINLTSMENALAEMAANNSSAADILSEKGYMQTTYASSIGFSELFVIAAAFFAILFAVQGFSFLYSRQKMDLYMSVPVSGPKRFALIWVNGVIGFGTAYLVSLVLCWGIGAAYGVLGAAMLAQSMIAFLVNMLAFTAMYNVALLAVMLTGNVLTALLGCSVLFFYEIVVRLIFSGLKTMFFFSYCAVDDDRLMNMPWITPFAGFYSFCTRVWYRNGILYGYYGNHGWHSFGTNLLTEALLLLLVGTAAGLLAYWLFRKRRTESYHQAIAFPVMKPVLEFFLLVPFSVAVGILVSRTAGDTGAFLFAGAAGGVLIGHAFIQLIYERELKALVRRKVLAAFCLFTSLLALCVFRFDLTGFDRFLPQKEEVAAVSVSLENDYSNFGRYGVPFFYGAGSLAVDDLLESMNSARPDTIDAVLSLAGKWQEAGMPGDGNDTGRNGESAVAEGKEVPEDSRRWIVCYTLNSGRQVTRRFYADGSASAEELNTIMQDPAYKKLRYQVYEEAFSEALPQMKISYYDGRQELLYTGDKETLLEAFCSDFDNYGYHMLTENLPCGELKFVLKNPDDSNYGNLTWDYPVYGSFEATAAVLSENDIDAGEKDGFLAAEDVSSITVRYYHYDEREDSLFLPGEVEEQEIVCTIEKPDEIGRLLEALYPEALSDAAGEEISYIDRDTRFSVSITLTPEALKKRWSVSDLFLLKEKEPDFLEKRIKEAAVYG